MFKDWEDYTYYLLENLITDEYFRKRLYNKFKKLEIRYADFPAPDDMYKAMVKCIVCNDVEGTKIRNWDANPAREGWRKWKMGKRSKHMIGARYIPQEGLVEEIIEYQKNEIANKKRISKSKRQNKVSK